jgi:hypothetical protein
MDTTRTRRRTWLWVGALLLLVAGTAQAVPITFDFTFQDPNSTAKAVGLVTFEANLLPNPEMCTEGSGFDLPNPAVLALQVTVSGASSGNGTFGLTDFNRIAWCTNRPGLDLCAELVGQSTWNDPWGTPSDGDGGDFNLFGFIPEDPDPPTLQPPYGEWYFTLCADGGQAECMLLTSMLARECVVVHRGVPAPVLDLKGFVGVILAMLAVGAVALRRRA